MESRASAQDTRLSYEARGVIGYLLSKPDDWNIEPDDLVCAGCGRDKVYRILKELTSAGYLKREKCQGDHGRWTWKPYSFQELPCAPYPEKPDTEKPDTVPPYTALPDTVPPYTEKPEIKDSVLDSLASDKTEQQDTELQGANAPARAHEGEGSLSQVDTGQPYAKADTEPSTPKIISLWQRTFVNRPVPSGYHNALLAAEQTYAWDWLESAFAEAKNAQYPWPYIRKVLESWSEAGQKTPLSVTKKPKPAPKPAPAAPTGPQIYRTKPPTRKATAS